VKGWTFKREAQWMMWLNLALPAIALAALVWRWLAAWMG
jgi:hypothetical protein